MPDDPAATYQPPSYASYLDRYQCAIEALNLSAERLGGHVSDDSIADAVEAFSLTAAEFQQMRDDLTQLVRQRLSDATE